MSSHEGELTLPSDRFRLEEINLPEELSAKLAGQTVRVEVLPEEPAKRRKVPAVRRGGLCPAQCTASRCRRRVQGAGFGSAGVGEAPAVALHSAVRRWAGAQPLGSLGNGRRPGGIGRPSVEVLRGSFQLIPTKFFVTVLGLRVSAVTIGDPIDKVRRQPTLFRETKRDSSLADENRALRKEYIAR
jgi:hypothetical protein